MFSKVRRIIFKGIKIGYCDCYKVVPWENTCFVTWGVPQKPPRNGKVGISTLAVSIAF